MQGMSTTSAASCLEIDHGLHFHLRAHDRAGLGLLPERGRSHVAGPMFGPGRHDEPFPIEAALDLRGLLRLLYIVTPRSDVLRRQRLAKMGEDLSIAIELAERPQHVGLAAAWNRAERVCRELGEVIGETTGTQLGEAAVARLRKISR
jgi:hypothetical protein